MLADTIFYAPDSGQIRQAVIMFHGYGSNGNDLIGLAPELAKQIPDTIFYAPNAPDVLNAAGYKWFDIDDAASASAYSQFDYVQKIMERAVQSLAGITGFVRYLEFKHSLKQSNVVLMGFSQGALLALLAGLCSAPAVKGIVACSSLPLAINDALKLDDIKSKPPVLLTHGSADDVVPLTGMEMTENTLKNIECDTTVHVKDGMGHAIDDSCVQAMIDFMAQLN